MLKYLITTLLILNPLTLAVAATWHVSPQGSDENDGTSPATAFATVQHGLDQMQSGDTLILAPGEYFEAASISDIGTDGALTTIRSAIPGSAVLRGDVPAPEFKRADGYDFVYVATLDTDLPVQVVNERDSLRVLQAVGNVAELEFKPGAFYFDAPSKRLYLSTSDARPPSEHDITLTLLKGEGLLARNATNLVIEGIGATGFNIGEYGEGGAGIALEDSRDSVIRDCTAWFNGFGIEIRSGDPDSGGNVIEQCLAWGNSSPFTNFRRGGITAMRHRNDTIRDSEAYYNTATGIYLRIHGDDSVPGHLIDNIGWGNRWDLIIKTNPGNSLSTIERSIGDSVRERSNPRNGLYRELVGGNYAEWPADTIFLDDEEGLVMEDEFADPQNRDYRLQATSRFRGTAPDGGDRGPFPYKANVYFVSENGDDGEDGLSASKAWRTLKHATAQLQPGDTLYIEPGMYSADLDLTVRGTDEALVSIRGRGREPVQLDGTLSVQDSSFVEFERLRFTKAVKVQGGNSISFSHCTFSGSGGVFADATEGLTLRHCAFNSDTRPAVAASGIQGLTLTGNHIHATSAPAIEIDETTQVRYADYNAYPYAPQRAWSARPGSNVEAHSLDTSAYAGSAQLDAVLQTRGPLGRHLGPFALDPLEQPLALLEGPRVHSTSATTANIEWLANLPCEVEIAWGSDPQQLNNRVRIDADSFGTFSLTGLAPDTRYYFKVVALRESTKVVGQHTLVTLGKLLPTTLDTEPLGFTTAASDRAPVTWHVSPSGDNANDGTSASSPLATIQAAANRANVGDTVLIGSGEYIEQVRIRSTGAEGKPITFRAADDAEVVLAAGPAELSDAFTVHNKSHLQFDHMSLLSMQFNLYRADDIAISRIYAGRYSRGYAPGFLHADLCDGLRIANCIALSAKSGPRIRGCDNVHIRNSVFYRNMINQLIIECLPGASVIVENCIFTDGLETKSRAAMIELGRAVGFYETNNCYYPRQSRWEEKPIVRLYSDFAFERARVALNIPEPTVSHPVVEELLPMNFEEMQEYFGNHGSIVADPEFAGLSEYPGIDANGNPRYTVDRMTGMGVIPFENFFATNPELIERDIGLQRSAFE